MGADALLSQVLASHRWAKRAFAAQHASILQTFQPPHPHHTSRSATGKKQAQHCRISLFYGYDFSRHGMIGSHRQDIDRFPIMLLHQRHCHMPIPREGPMPIHVRHSYPNKSIHAMYYNLACIVVVSIISVVI